MPKYAVKAEATVEFIIFVEAESEEEATDKAEESKDADLVIEQIKKVLPSGVEIGDIFIGCQADLIE